MPTYKGFERNTEEVLYQATQRLMAKDNRRDIAALSPVA